MQKAKYFLFILSVMIVGNGFAQINKYDFKRAIDNAPQGWAKIVLPEGVPGKLNDSQTDIRIYGISDSDTVEVPYILNITSSKIIHTGILSKQINSSRQGKRWFYTFEVPTHVEIDHLDLNFEEKNFDRRVQLQGSNDQKSWFTILSDYRIVAIHNKVTDYTFSRLEFPPIKYAFLGVSFLSDKKPVLLTASVSREKFTNGRYRSYPAKITSTRENDYNQTEINFSLKQKLPVSSLKFKVREKFDYYRPAKIQYLVDSVKTQKGWLYDYRDLADVVFSSVDTGAFHIAETIAAKWRVVIYNNDNIPLHIDSVQVRGYIYELIARFPGKMDYWLVYGSEESHRPNYDIARFTDSIPDNLPAPLLGKEQKIEKADLEFLRPLFENKLWLWGILGVIIILLGWFSLKMLKS